MPVEKLKPQCRGGHYGTDLSAAPHGAHSYCPFAETEAVECRGWAQQEADAVALARRLDRVALDYAYPLQMPQGIRLECHPLVPHALMQVCIPSYAEFTAGLKTGEVPKPSIPVVVTAMERGQWRITADDGLIAEGTVRDG